MTTAEDDINDARAYLEARGYVVLAPDTPPTPEQVEDIIARMVEPLVHLTGPGEHSEKETP